MDFVVIKGPAGSGKTTRLTEQRERKIARGEVVTDILVKGTTTRAIHSMLLEMAKSSGRYVYAFMDEVHPGDVHALAEALSGIKGTFYIVVHG